MLHNGRASLVSSHLPRISTCMTDECSGMHFFLLDIMILMLNSIETPKICGRAYLPLLHLFSCRPKGACLLSAYPAERWMKTTDLSMTWLWSVFPFLSSCDLGGPRCLGIVRRPAPLPTRGCSRHLLPPRPRSPEAALRDAFSPNVKTRLSCSFLCPGWGLSHVGNGKPKEKN